MGSNQKRIIVIGGEGKGIRYDILRVIGYGRVAIVGSVIKGEYRKTRTISRGIIVCSPTGL